MSGIETDLAVSPTLEINERTARRRAAGAATLPLGFGEAGLPVLPALAERLARAARHGEYGPVAGVAALRGAAAGYWQRRGLRTNTEQVIVGPGSKALLYALLRAIDGPVALPSPSWVSYAAQAALIGRPAQLISTLHGQGGAPAPQRLDEAARAATASGAPLRAVVLTLPDNPTGTLPTPSVVAELCDVAERHDLVVISDEIYRDLLHDPKTPFVSPAEIAPHRTVITTGLSKNLALGGWRLGVARFPGAAMGSRLRSDVLAIASEVWSAAAHPVQIAAGWAFTEPPEVRQRIALSRQLHAAIARATSRVLAHAHIDHPPPAGGFYLYPNYDMHRKHLADAWSIHTSRDLATVLLEHHGIATLPGSAFGEPDNTLTLRLATSQLYGDTDQQAEEALQRADPANLPWIDANLRLLANALTSLTTSASGSPVKTRARSDSSHPHVNPPTGSQDMKPHRGAVVGLATHHER